MEPQDNRRIYEQAKTAKSYERDSVLLSPEVMLFLRYCEHIKNGRVLDIGCGAGRTTPYLAFIAGAYVGIDYSSQMVQLCREKFPDLEFFQEDARDLSEYPEGAYDFILFSYNGIDSVDHEGRLGVLANVYRLLRPGGVFVFSSHNRLSAAFGTFPRLKLVKSPCRQATYTLQFVKSVVNYSRNKKHHRHEAEYSLVTDAGHQHSLLHYYIAPADQFRQLRDAGFEPRDIFGIDGSLLSVSDDVSNHNWLHYAAVKSMGE